MSNRRLPQIQTLAELMAITVMVFKLVVIFIASFCLARCLLGAAILGDNVALGIIGLAALVVYVGMKILDSLEEKFDAVLERLGETKGENK